jgi:hypothetical protein
MARKRHLQSTADYLAIAISPVLIMLLVGSLVFFLQEVSYNGQYQPRVRWVLGWFVFATVLISRIGIEFGKAQASMYAGALALACMAFIWKFLDEYLIGTAVLMGVTWWCVNKLTWDCTVIDDNDDASGAGLLQQSGMDKPPPDEEDETPPETEKQRRRRLRREQLLGEPQASDRPSQQPDPSELESPEKKKQHAPGVWVVYFSLAALPLFGIGQAFLPAEDDGAIREGFLFLWIYVASALGLFLTTSFLGLRRYLRQRRIKMPVRITAAWVTSGVVIMMAVLGLCLLIPRPHSGTSVTAMLDRFADDQEASDAALSGDDAGKGEGRHVGKADEDADEGNKVSEKGEPTESDQGAGKQGQSEQKGENKGGKQKNDDQQGGNKNNQEVAKNDDQGEKEGERPKNDENQQDQKQRQQNSSQRTSRISRAISKLAKPVKWILYIVFGILILWALWKNRHNLAAGAREFLQAISDFWANLFNRKPKKKKKKKTEQAPELIETGPPPKRFAEYDNPFLTGQAHRMRPDALVIYTEEAFRAFGRELGVQDGEDITTAEFGDEVTARLPELAEAIRFLTGVHSRILYSSQPPTSFDISLLETLWTGMTRREPQAVG